MKLRHSQNGCQRVTALTTAAAALLHAMALLIVAVNHWRRDYPFLPGCLGSRPSHQYSLLRRSNDICQGGEPTLSARGAGVYHKKRIPSADRGASDTDPEVMDLEFGEGHPSSRGPGSGCL